MPATSGLTVPVMYAILLMLARKAIRNHTPNHLVRSISFLHRDYKPGARARIAHLPAARPFSQQLESRGDVRVFRLP
eukprot:5168173-Prymnesium_polylepis.1